MAFSANGKFAVFLICCFLRTAPPGFILAQCWLGIYGFEIDVQSSVSCLDCVWRRTSRYGDLRCKSCRNIACSMTYKLRKQWGTETILLINLPTILNQFTNESRFFLVYNLCFYRRVFSLTSQYALLVTYFYISEIIF